MALCQKDMDELSSLMGHGGDEAGGSAVLVASDEQQPSGTGSIGDPQNHNMGQPKTALAQCLLTRGAPGISSVANAIKAAQAVTDFIFPRGPLR